GDQRKDIESSSQRRKASSTSISDLEQQQERSNSDRILDDVNVEPPDEPANVLKISSQKPINLRVFSFGELRSATKNFSRTLMVGEGGFGCVYKGLIKDLDDPQAKIEVAVKRLNNKGLQGHKEWVTEVHFLGLVEHPNLVKLVGYCAEDDERGIQRLLVYEFMPNKSLEDHLFSRTLTVLPWPVRLKVALGAACGLANLHEELDVQIIFRDFKSSNILLDENFDPKLSDFGLARQGPAGGISHVSTAVVGTAGYAAPEYVQTGHLTAKSDVWSFGVVLYELLTGRRSMDKNRPKSEQKLLEWVKPFLSESKKFPLILDPKLEGKYSLREAQKIAYLAHRCLVKQPKARPKMSEVVKQLKRIIETSEPGSPPVVTSPSAERDTASKEQLKEPVNSKRHFLLLRHMVNLRSRKNDAAKLFEWQTRDDKAKSIIGLALSDTELHYIDLEKKSKDIWDVLSKTFGAKAVNAKFSLKLQLFKLKMNEGATMSSHINDLRSLLRQLTEVSAQVDEEDAKTILLNSLPPKYSNVVFTLGQMPSHSLEGMISALLVEEKRTKEDIEEETALYTKRKHTNFFKNKEELECFYCKKKGHKSSFCITRAKDIIKGKLKMDEANTIVKEESENEDEDEPEQNEDEDDYLY
ncbi:hypothetical protein KI387_015669, partial [Taxus chinensis]